MSSSDSETILDLFVENMGRNNFGSPGQFDQKKGLPEGPVLVDDEIVNNWTMYPFEFKGPWIRRWRADTDTIFKFTIQRLNVESIRMYGVYMYVV